MYLDGVECALRQIIVCGMPKSSQYALAREKKRCAGRDYHKAKSARDGKQLRKKRRERRAMSNMVKYTLGTP